MTEDVVKVGIEITFTMLNKDSDAAISAFRTAVAAGSTVALRLKDWSSGVGFDGDVTLALNHDKPLGGRQELSFTATPTKQDGRSYTLFA
jgi:hypothetical protein